MKKIAEAIEVLANTMGRTSSLFPVSVFLKVASEEGITMHEIGQELGLLSATTSITVKKLSTYKTKKGIEGLDLIETRQDLDHRKRYACYLTPKGTYLKEQLEEILHKE